jgi:hypothetical protein
MKKSPGPAAGAFSFSFPPSFGRCHGRDNEYGSIAFLDVAAELTA